MSLPFVLGQIPTASDFNSLVVASTLSATNGAGLIGGGGQFVNNMAALRALSKTAVSTAVFTLGYYAAGDAGASGPFYYDPNDTTSSENGVTIIVGNDGARYKLAYSGVLNAAQGGAKYDGVTDAVPFINNIATVLTGGGTIRITGKCLIDSAITLPSGVALQGDRQFVGTLGVNNTQGSKSDTARGCLIINSTVTVSFSGSSGVRNLLVLRKGMTFPAADTSLYAGTAFTGIGDDYFVVECLIIGFNKTVYSTNVQRPRIQNVNFDGINGVEVANCADISHINECHAWPFGTISGTSTVASNLRTGTAYYFHDLGDWNKVSNCFSYGYKVGFQVTNCNSMTLLSCSTDGNFPNATPGMTGFLVSGTSNDTRLHSCQAAAQDLGFQINTNANLHTSIIGGNLWSNASHNAIVAAGDATFIGVTSRDTAYGFSVANATSKVQIEACRTSGISSAPILNNNSTPYLYVGDNDYGDFTGNAVVSGTTPIVAIASATTVAIPSSGKVFSITGTVAISALNGFFTGREITLVFSAATTVVTGAVSPNGILLNGNANFVTAANSALTLMYQGDHWIEVGRKA